MPAARDSASTWFIVYLPEFTSHAITSAAREYRFAPLNTFTGVSRVPSSGGSPGRTTDMPVRDTGRPWVSASRRENRAAEPDMAAVVWRRRTGQGQGLGAAARCWVPVSPATMV